MHNKTTNSSCFTKFDTSSLCRSVELLESCRFGTLLFCRGRQCLVSGLPAENLRPLQMILRNILTHINRSNTCWMLWKCNICIVVVEIFRLSQQNSQIDISKCIFFLYWPTVSCLKSTTGCRWCTTLAFVGSISGLYFEPQLEGLDPDLLKKKKIGPTYRKLAYPDLLG